MMIIFLSLTTPSSSYDTRRLDFAPYYVPQSNQNLQAFYVELVDLKPDQQMYYGITGNYTQVGFRINLVRHSSPYVTKYFVPCFAMVLISFISFVIPPEAIPGRTGLLVTLFLVLVTVFRGAEVSG